MNFKNCSCLFGGFFIALIAIAPAHAQKTKAQLNTEIGANFPDNMQNQITPLGIRNVTLDTVNSIMPTAPVVSGNTPCFDGTTGLLKDCGSNILNSPITNGHLLANATGSSAVPMDTAPSTWFDQAFCNTVGYIIARTTGGWACSKSIPVNPTFFGAVGNGSTDDTAALTSAFAAAASSKIVFPPGLNFKVNGSGTNIFNIAAPIIIDCQGSSITLDATVPNTRNLFQFKPTSAGDRLPSRRITRCLFNMNSVGNNVILIDTTATNTIEIGEFEIDHVRDTASAGASGYSINVNNVITNTNGGLFNVNFHDNVLNNCIFLNQAGDSIRVKDNILSGAKCGVNANLISGAAGLLISGNNISAAAPILVDAAIGNTVIINNEVEQQITNTNPNNALVEIRGAVGTITHVTMTGNSLSALASTGSPAPLRLGAVSSAYVESNVLQTSASVVCLVNTSGGTGTIVGAANSWIGCSSNVSNAGTLKYVQVGASP